MALVGFHSAVVVVVVIVRDVLYRQQEDTPQDNVQEDEGHVSESLSQSGE